MKQYIIIIFKTHEKSSVVFIIFSKTNGGSKTFSEPHRARTKSETTSVFVLCYIYRFKNIIHIVLQYENSENNMYCAHTGVDPGMFNMGDIMSTSQSPFPSYHLPYSGVKVKSPHMRPLTQVDHRGPQYYVISPCNKNPCQKRAHVNIYTYVIKNIYIQPASGLINKSIQFTNHVHIII